MGAKHTPGPWFNEGTDVFSTAGGYPAVIAEADVPQDEPTPTKGEKLANARLIAAAPELVDVLERLKSFPFTHQGTGEGPLAYLIEDANAAIAKAKGA
jgi:hypothetical protein